MTPTLIRYEPDYATHPGELLLEAIEERNMTQLDLARHTAISTKHLNQIIKGKASITAETALRLEQVLGTSAKYWNNLQANFDDHRVRLEARHQADEVADWVMETFPIGELRKRCWLPKGDRGGALALALFKFFGVSSKEGWLKSWGEQRLAFRISTSNVKLGALASWVRVVELQAKREALAPYDEQEFQKVLKTIRDATPNPPENAGEWIKSLCATAGVIIVFEPEIAGARASGVAFWSGANAVIGLSGRYKRDDHFWFSFFHEAGHIVLHRKHGRLVDQVDDETTAVEHEANEFAARLLIPVEFENGLASLHSERDIEAFARRIGIAPGIVVGRLQRDRKQFNRWNRLRKSINLVNE
jgi:HTH-type transcriptional regulator / antitoxin HigA